MTVPPHLDENSEPTESIDLSTLFREDLTTSGSFEVTGIRRTEFGKLLCALPVAAALIDISGTITFCNEGWGRMSQSYKDLEGRSLASIVIGSQEALAAEVLIEEVFEQRKPKLLTTKIRIMDTPFWARLFFRPVRLAGERLLLVLIEDITLEKRQLALLGAIQRAKKEWEQTFDAATDLIALVDSRQKILRINRAMAERAGVSIKEAVGMSCCRLMHATDKPPPFCTCSRVFLEGRKATVEYYEERLRGYFMESLSPIRNEHGSITGVVCVVRDITDRKRLEEDLKHKATHDSLTDLLNHSHVRDMLMAAWESANRYGHPLSLYLSDIDRFKQVNDRYGHQTGDRVLATYGDIIRQELRGADIAGRYGGDEFIIGFPNTSARGALESAERIRVRLSRVVFANGSKEFSVSCTAGVAELVHGKMTVEDLINFADEAMYEAKSQGRNCVRIAKPPKKYR